MVISRILENVRIFIRTDLVLAFFLWLLVQYSHFMNLIVSFLLGHQHISSTNFSALVSLFEETSCSKQVPRFAASTTQRLLAARGSAAKRTAILKEVRITLKVVLAPISGRTNGRECSQKVVKILGALSHSCPAITIMRTVGSYMCSSKEM